MSNDNSCSPRRKLARLGVSVRSLERYAKAGRLVHCKRDAKHGKEAVVDAESLDTLKAELDEPSSDVVLEEPKSDKGSTSLDIRSDDGLSLLVEAITAFAEAANMRLLAPGAGNAKAPAHVPIADKLKLSLKKLRRWPASRVSICSPLFTPATYEPKSAPACGTRNART